MAIGRPPKVNYDDLLNDLDEYIATAKPPIVAEYAHLHGITRQRLYSLADEKKAAGDSRLFDAIRKLSESKEIALERGGLTGKYAANMAIFSLKQLGWSDRQAAPSYGEQAVEDDPLTKALKEEAARMDEENAD